MHQNYVPKPSQAGFTLIETVLVLVVVGLIMGAIWAGYATAMRMKHQSISEQQIADVLQVSRNYMLQANENTSCTTNYYGNPCGTNDITAALITNNLLPASITGTQTNNTLLTEYGTLNVIANTSAENPYGSGPFIELAIAGVQQTNCSDLASAWGGSPDRVASSGMIGIAINQTGTALSTTTNLLNGATNGAITSSAIVAGCNAASNNIDLFFRLNP
jgi:prepilin-type N-terminal cleavage/methylation domain-containing protein